MTRLRCAAFVLVASFSSACATSEVNLSIGRRGRLTATRSLAGGALSMLQAPRIDAYTIGPEDVLEVAVLDLKQLGETHLELVQVDLEGRIGLPLIGRIEAAGRTTRELREEVAERLGEKFLQNPEVTINLKEYRSKRIAVLGAFESPGVVTLKNNTTTVVEAIALGGGLNEKTGNRALLVRAARDGKEPIAIEVDLEALAAGDVSENYVIYPRDVLNVPAAPRFYVAGLVQKPGEYFLYRSITATEAIAAAGGLVDPDASPDLTVIRRFGQPPEEVDLTLIAKGLAEDPLLQPNDILEARQGFWWGLTLGVYRFVKNGVGFGYNLAAGIPPAF